MLSGPFRDSFQVLDLNKELDRKQNSKVFTFSKAIEGRKRMMLCRVSVDQLR